MTEDILRRLVQASMSLPEPPSVIVAWKNAGFPVPPGQEHIFAAALKLAEALGATK